MSNERKVVNHTLSPLLLIGDEFEVAEWGRVGRFEDYDGGIWRERILACSRACAGVKDPEAAVSHARAALAVCLGAMDAMRTQIDQMSGMFKDEDGRIAQACADHFEAAQRTRIALKAIIQEV